MNTEDQIRELFGELGMNVGSIRYNDSLDYYHVNIDAEGTDEQYLEDIHELGSDGPVDSKVDSIALQQAGRKIDGAEIADGAITVSEMMGDAHYQLKVE